MMIIVILYTPTFYFTQKTRYYYYMDYFDIEQSIEDYYRNIIANDIEDSLYSRHSQESISDKETYWFNCGMRMAAMIARHSTSE